MLFARSILFLLILSALFGVLIILPTGALPPALGFALNFARVLLALLWVVFLPGYALQAALFKPDQLDDIARGALAIGMSYAIFPLIAFVLDKLPWRLIPLSFFGALACVVLTCTIIAVFRRRRLYIEQTVTISKPLEEIEHDHRTWFHRFTSVQILKPSARGRLYAVCFAAAAIALTAGLVTLIPRSPHQLFTEFYVINADGLAENFPRQIIAGDEMQLVVGIVNQEGAEKNYQVEIHSNEDVLAHVRDIQLPSGGRSELPLRFALTEPGEDVQVYFLLFKDGDTEPYRRLRLVMDVITATQSLSTRAESDGVASTLASPRKENRGN